MIQLGGSEDCILVIIIQYVIIIHYSGTNDSSLLILSNMVLRVPFYLLSSTVVLSIQFFYYPVWRYLRLIRVGSDLMSVANQIVIFLEEFS
jgi:hypothetical protein